MLIRTILTFTTAIPMGNPGRPISDKGQSEEGWFKRRIST